MAKKFIKPTTALFPVPVVMVSCRGTEGKPNIITIAWTGVVCSNPPMVHISVRKNRFSYRLIKESMEFVINVPSQGLLRTTDYCGMVSGRRVDKFKACNLTTLPAEKVKAPLIKECPVNLECRVKNIFELGTHDLFLAEVVAVHADEGIMDHSEEIDILKLDLIAYCPWAYEYWSLGQRVGSYGFSKGKAKG